MATCWSAPTASASFGGLCVFLVFGGGGRGVGGPSVALGFGLERLSGPVPLLQG